VAKNVVIVESPAKAKTIERYLGKDYHVAASMGHVRDLPQKKLGVDIENDFAPTYTPLPGKKKVLDALKKATAGKHTVYMATDLDREGEAIAWHLCEALGLDPLVVHRVTFNEITKSAIQEAFAHPGHIDMNKVSAQEARRILDRLVGYKLSPLLWKKVAKGLSAGRVQSVAVRLVVEREREIRAYVPEESWRITAHLSRPGDAHAFSALLAEVDGRKFATDVEADARRLGDLMRKAAYRVRSIAKRSVKDSPLPPFITSQLQRAASTMLGFSTKKTMTLAQRLYQGVELGAEGSVALITYMRTDSHHVAASAQAAARELIQRTLGQEYVPEITPVYRSKGRAQEAHEAIRPTEVARSPESVRDLIGRDEARLYELIWRRFIASQMKPALWDVTDVEVEAAAQGAIGLFKARGRTLVFDGHTKVSGLRTTPEEQHLPALEEGAPLELKDLEETQHFTQPPPRYSEATLVRRLEELGIGRPSTYAAIVTTIEERGYVEQKNNLFLRCEKYPDCQYTVPCDLHGKPVGPKIENTTCNACKAKMSLKEGKRCFFATELGEVVTDKLVQHFPKIMDAKFTSHMEDELDGVEEARTDWLDVIREFWGPFSEALAQAGENMESTKHQPVEDAGPCPKCGQPLVQRWSKNGPFLGCSGYPNCKYTRPLEGEARPEPKRTEHACEKCGGTMLLRVNRRGEPFLGCENYPKCKSTLPSDAEGNPIRPEPTGETCEKCGSPMVVKRGRRGPFLACSAYPKCRNAKPLGGGKKEGAGDEAKAPDGAPGESKPKAPPRRKAPATLTDRDCPDCGKKLVIRSGRRGQFLGCSGYPKCRHTENLPDDLAAPDET
jgi:DNA topoisomerase-1